MTTPPARASHQIDLCGERHPLPAAPDHLALGADERQPAEPPVGRQVVDSPAEPRLAPLAVERQDGLDGDLVQRAIRGACHSGEVVRQGRFEGGAFAGQREAREDQEPGEGGAQDRPPRHDPGGPTALGSGRGRGDHGGPEVTRK